MLSQVVGKERAENKVSVLLVIEQGMVDRGADLKEVSQYPGEEEILFPPLVALEVVSRR